MAQTPPFKPGKKLLKPSKPSSPPSEQNTTVLPTIAALVEELGIDRDWDYIVIGDGSGTSLKKPIGWGAAVVHNTGRIHSVYGSASHGTNIVAEIMALAYALVFIEPRVKLGRTAKIALVTDCQYVAQCGNRQVRRSKHASLWAMVDSFARIGLQLRFYWLHRERVGLNHYAHVLANIARLKAHGLGATALEGFDVPSILDITPEE